MQHFQDVILDKAGNVIAGASVYVYTQGTTNQVTIYSDNGSTIASQPLTTDAAGGFGFYAADAALTIHAVSGSFTADRDITLFDPYTANTSDMAVVARQIQATVEQKVPTAAPGTPAAGHVWEAATVLTHGASSHPVADTDREQTFSAAQIVAAPATAGKVALKVKGNATANTNVLEVYDSAGTPALQTWVDSTGTLGTNKNLTFKSGTNFTMTLDHALTADRTVQIPDAGAASSVVLTESSQTLNGDMTLTGATGIKKLNNIRKADQFPGADAGAKIQAAHDDLPSSGGIVDATGLEGTVTAAASITLSKACHLMLPRGMTVSGSPGIDVTGDDVMITGDGFGTTLQVSGAVVAIRTSKERTRIQHFQVKNGTVGVDVVSGAGTTQIENMRFRNQTTAFIRYGEVGLETDMRHIDCARDTAGTTADGILISRTAVTDTGGVYLDDVRVVAAAGTITNGFRFTSSAGGRTGMPIMAQHLVADGIATDGYIFKNISGGQFITDSWASMNDGSNYCVTIDNAAEFNWKGGRVASESTGTNGCFRFQNGSSDCSVEYVECINGPAISLGPATAVVRLFFAGLNPEGTGATLTNNFSALNTAAGVDQRMGLKVYTESGGTDDSNTFTLQCNNGGATPKFRLRADGGGSLSMVNSSGATINQFDQSGTLYQGQAGSTFTLTAGSSTTPTIGFDTNDAYKYDRTSDEHQQYIGGTKVVGVTASTVALASGVGVTFNADTNLYRDSANVLRTDDSLIVTTNLTVGGTLSNKDLTEVVTGTNVIAATETGSVFFLNSATEFVSTLPAPAAGLHFTFIVTAAPSGASYTVVTTGGATIIKGHVVSSQDAGGSADSETSGAATVTFVDSKAVIGDMAEFWCDGTNWFVRASCKQFDAITIS